MSLRDKIEHAIQNQPCTVKDLKARFGGDRGADRKVMEALDALVHEAVVFQRSGVFFTVRSGRAEKALLCKVVKLGKNFAFVMLEDETSDIFIPGRFTRGAMPGDEVLVEKFEHPRVEGSDEGAILAVLTEKNDLVGTARRIEGRLKFVPDDCPAISMQLMRNCEGGAKDGDKVAVEILMRGSRQEDHRVGVAMRFGSSDEAKRCAKALLYARDIHTRFPDKVREEAKKFEGMTVSEEDCKGRMDLRALPIFTIDSAETKDIDDAISLTRTPEGGFELGVHIADVSNYVKPGSELNEEAFNRATSVYYADQVVPMLPKSLSNGICSLNEKELRLAFSCLMRLDKDGNLTDYRFVKSVICSRVKGVYAEINALLAGTADAEIQAKYAEVADQLPAMKELYAHRARLRTERGCIDFESGEVKLILDEDGHCIDVKKRTSGESEAMIEEFMLLAEICAWAKDRGKTLFDVLMDIYVEYGFSKETTVNVVKPGKSGADEIKAMMENFRANPPKEIGGSKVILAKDYKTLKATDGEGNVADIDMPETSNVLQYFTEDGTKISVRPSGTEPKIKFYMEVKGEMGCPKCYDAANAAAEEKVEAVRKSLGI